MSLSPAFAGLFRISKKSLFFSPYTLYNWNFYFYNWVTLAGIAQLVEHDLAKVEVEGPSPFSRSKKEKPPAKVVFFFYIVIWTRAREEGATKFFRGRSPWKEFRIYRTAINP